MASRLGQIAGGLRPLQQPDAHIRPVGTRQRAQVGARAAELREESHLTPLHRRIAQIVSRVFVDERFDDRDFESVQKTQLESMNQFASSETRIPTERIHVDCYNLKRSGVSETDVKLYAALNGYKFTFHPVSGNVRHPNHSLQDGDFNYINREQANAIVKAMNVIE